MPSLTARLSAAAVAVVFVLFASAPAQAQDTGGGVAGDPTTPTAGDPMPTPAEGDIEAIGAGAAPPPPPPGEDTIPPEAPLVPPADPVTPAEPATQVTPADPVTPMPPAAPTAQQLQTEPVTTDITFVQPVDPAQVTVPPQPGGPLTIGSFSSAVNNQAQNLARLNRLGAIPGERITVINVARLNPGPATTATARGMGTPTTGVDNAISRAEARSAASARTAASNNASISSALSAANISADNVLAIAVRGHNLNDVTIYHR